MSLIASELIASEGLASELIASEGIASELIANDRAPFKTIIIP